MELTENEKKELIAHIKKEATLHDLEVAKNAYFDTRLAWHNANGDLDFNQAHRLEKIMDQQWAEIDRIIVELGNN